MMKFHNFQLFVSCNVLLFSITASLVAYAEVVFDGTLGFKGALEGPHYQIGAELGQQHGGNLFQSFSHFNINTAESATFSGSNSVQNIISRVTGGNPSHINGLIRSTVPNADMYFLNPYGIIFGEGASLDVQGSFHASTADTLRFSDGSEFNARTPNNSLLTIAPIEAFGFLTDAPSAIMVQDAKLSVSEGKTLSLIGGGIHLNVKQLPIYEQSEPTFNTGLEAEFGKINLASIASRGEVIPTEHGLNISTDAQGGSIAIKNTQLNTSGKGGGAIFIRAGHFSLDNSVIETSTLGAKNGKGIFIYAKKFVLNNSLVGSETSGIGNASTVDIETEQLHLTGDAQILTGTIGKGQGGKIHIKVTGELVLSQEETTGRLNGIFTRTNSEANDAGNAGNINIEAGQLYIADGGQIRTKTLGKGQGGIIHIKVKENTTLSGETNPGTRKSVQSGIRTDTSSITYNSGKAGSIILETKELNIKDGGIIISWNKGSGKSGNIEVYVTEKISLSGYSLSGGGQIATITGNNDESTGNAGTIRIEAKQLYMTDGRQISTSSFGNGKNGKIHIKVAEDIMLFGNQKSKFCGGGICPTGIFNEPGNKEDGNEIFIETGQLQLIDGAQISTSTYGLGQASNIRIVTKHIVISSIDSSASSGIFTNSYAKGNNGGSAGNIIVESEQLNMSKGAQISSSTFFGSGDGGNIDINVISANITGNIGFFTGIFTGSHLQATGNGGKILLKAKRLNISNGARLSTQTRSEGKGGNIEIRANYISLHERGAITAESTTGGTGNAGEIIINVNNTLNSQKGFIKTSTEGASGGNIYITSPGYLYLTDSEITTSVFAEKGNGGNMALDPEFIVLDNSKIIAQAYEGRGGNIDITTTGIYNNTVQGISESPLRTAINASSQLGINGEVQINTPEIDVMEGLFTLSVDFLDASQLFKAGCTPRTIANTFLSKGHHKVALKNLLKTSWASFFFDDKYHHQDTEKKVAESNLFDGNFSLTNSLIGCGNGN
jgi:filamentous hemagglutinin family protein